MVCSHSYMMSLHAALLLEKKDYPHSGLCTRMQWKSAPVTKWPGIMAPSVPETRVSGTWRVLQDVKKPPLTSCQLPLQTCDADDQNTDEFPGFAEITSYKFTYMKRHKPFPVCDSSLGVCFPLRSFSRLSEKSCTRVCGGWCLHKVNISIPLRKGEL